MKTTMLLLISVALSGCAGPAIQYYWEPAPGKTGAEATHDKTRCLQIAYEIDPRVGGAGDSVYKRCMLQLGHTMAYTVSE